MTRTLRRVDTGEDIEDPTYFVTSPREGDYGDEDELTMTEYFLHLGINGYPRGKNYGQ
jgi:hypothetical protein